MAIARDYRETVETTNPEIITHTVPLVLIQSQPEVYCNYPDYQRRYRQPRRIAQSIIDTALRGWPIPPPLAFVRSDTTGTQRYYILDGKQRMETLRRYMANEFPTGGQAISGRKPLAPRKLYHQLPPNLQNQLKSYILRINVWVNFVPGIHDELFRRMAKQLPLTAAEQLLTHESEGNARAEKLASHPWLQAHIRPGQLERSQDHYLALLLLVAQGNRYALLQSKILEVLARGAGAHSPAHSTALTLDLRLAEQRATEFLDMLTVAGADLGYVNMFDLTALSQASHILREAGYTLRQLPRNCLTPWLPFVRDLVNRDRPFATSETDRAQSWARLNSERNQQIFCERYKYTVIDAVMRAGGGSRAAAR